MALPATVQLTNTLPDVVMAGDKVPLKFQASENYIETAGSKAEIILPWTQVAVANEYFDLTLFGTIVRFTCKAAPDNSGIQFHDNTLALTLNNWVALLAEDLQKNYLISKYYDVVVADADITITARENGAAYSMEFTAGAGIDCIPNEANKTGIDEAIREFYAVVLLLFINDDFIGEKALNIDNDGLAETDVSTYLRSYIENNYKWPEANSKFIYERSAAVIRWNFKYGERWGDGLYRALTDSDDYYAIEGALSWLQTAKYNKDGFNFWEKLLNNHNFLSNAPLTRYVTPGEPVKLYFLNWSAATLLTLKARLYSAGVETDVELDSFDSTDDKTIYEFVISPEMVNYTGMADETLEKIDVWLEDENGARISEKRIFIFDYAHYEHERYFMFKNSFGVYEIFRTTGLMTAIDDYERTTATVENESDYTGADREEISVLNKENQRFTVSAGWLSKLGDAEKYRNWLRDFALSKEVFEVTRDSIKPIRITATSLDNRKDRDNLRGFSFEFRNAFSDEFYSADEYEEDSPLISFNISLVRNEELDNNLALT